MAVSAMAVVVPHQSAGLWLGPISLRRSASGQRDVGAEPFRATAEVE
jgi:hypothetical protein